MTFTEIDNPTGIIGLDKPLQYEGRIPNGTDLVVVERNDVDNGTFESALVLYGFDEIGMFDDFNNPVYGFLGDK